MIDETDHELDWAIDYLTSTYPSLVDASKIALAGHSYGGITAVLAANRAISNKLAAIVDMSGAVLSFYTYMGGVRVIDPIWYPQLCIAASGRKQPMLMFQTTNESPIYTDPNFDLTDVVASTQLIFNCAISGSYATQGEMQVFSLVPGLDKNGPWCSTSDPDNQCAHTTFVMDPMQVNRWAPQVKDFLAHNGIAP